MGPGLKRILTSALALAAIVLAFTLVEEGEAHTGLVSFGLGSLMAANIRRPGDTAPVSRKPNQWTPDRSDL